MTATKIDVTDALADYKTEHVAEVCDVSVRTVQRWLKNGVDVWTADKIATKVIGDNPSWVWGRAWTDA